MSIILAVVFILFFCTCDKNPAQKQTPEDSIAAYKNHKTDTSWYRGFEIPTTRLGPPDYIKTWHGIDADSVLVINDDAAATLQYYAPLDNFRLNYWDGLLEIAVLNQTKFGFILIANDLFIYRFEKGKFRLQLKQHADGSLMSFGMETDSPFRQADLNFDGYKDITLEIPTHGVHGNIEYTCLLFDPVKKEMIPVIGNPLENITRDAEKKLIRSQHFSSVCGPSRKRLFRLVADSAVPQEEIVLFSMCAGTDLDSARIDHRIYTNGKEICNSQKMPSDKAWILFQKSLWNTENTSSENARLE